MITQQIPRHNPQLDSPPPPPPIMQQYLGSKWKQIMSSVQCCEMYTWNPLRRPDTTVTAHPHSPLMPTQQRQRRQQQQLTQYFQVLHGSAGGSSRYPVLPVAVERILKGRRGPSSLVHHHLEAAGVGAAFARHLQSQAASA